MPVCTANNGSVYYEVHGAGTPLLMITGMASVMDWFHFNIPEFVSRGYQVIAQDLRGSNREGARPPIGPYSTFDMAKDSVGVLNDLGVERAAVIGLSMGGMIAQHLAISFPNRVRAIVIAANGLARTPAEIKAAALAQVGDSPVAQMHASSSSLEERLAMALRLAFTPSFADDKPDRYRFFVEEIFMKHPALPETRAAQVHAACEHDTLDDLHTIRAPTQLLVGALDQINGGLVHQMAERIPGSDCRVLPGMSHGFTLEHADEFNALALDFLGRSLSG